jgi:membrane-bound serine protease (ClpP class)
MRTVKLPSIGPIGGLLLLGGVLLAPLPEIAGQTSAPLFDELFAILADPNVAYLLLVLGLLGLAAEVATGGTVLPGVAGTICLILALAGLGQLPTNWAGAALIFASIIMFFLDLHVSGFALSVGGLIAFALGSALLFSPPWSAPVEGAVVRISPWLILLTTGGVAAFFLLAIAAVLKSRAAPVAVGRRTLIGQMGMVQEALDPRGIVHAGGETWSAVSTGSPIAAGATVRIVGIQGLTLSVTPDTAVTTIDEGV